MKYQRKFHKGYKQRTGGGVYKSCVGKVRFATEDEASNYNKNVIKMKSRFHERIDKLRLYFCENCEGFHFTSKLKERNPQNEDENQLTDLASSSILTV